MKAINKQHNIKQVNQDLIEKNKHFCCNDKNYNDSVGYWESMVKSK